MALYMLIESVHRTARSAGVTMLNKRYRLTKRGSFAYVYKKGASRASGALRITFVRGKGVPKIGVSVPNTVGKAVVRNKVRRRIRAYMRGVVLALPPVQMVVSAKKGAENLTYAQLSAALTELLQKNGLYEKKTHGTANT